MDWERRAGRWLMHFPGDYRWSFNTLLALSLCRTGGAEVGEVDQVVRRLAGDVGDDERWFEEWVALGDRVRTAGEEAERAGNRLTAAAHYKRASCYGFVGERFRLPKDERALAVYAAAVDLFRQAIALQDGPRAEPVEVPFGSGHVPAVLVHAERREGERPPPVVVLYAGFDGNKELNWFFAMKDIAKRGISCLSVDTPGVGEAIRFRDVRLRHDYEVAGSAVLDHLETRDDVDAGRCGIMAMSLGGCYAPRTAAMEPRFQACVAWGAQWDYHELWRRRIATADPLLRVPGAHLVWSTGADGPEEALRRIEGFRLDGVVQRMRCPFLVCHGEDDQQVPLDHARRLCEAASSPDKQFRVFTADEGGAQHCNLDNLSLAVPVMCDWMAKRLGAAGGRAT